MRKDYLKINSKYKFATPCWNGSLVGKLCYVIEMSDIYFTIKVLNHEFFNELTYKYLDVDEDELVMVASNFPKYLKGK